MPARRPGSQRRPIPAGRAVSIETETFPALAAQRKLIALPAPPPLLDMGTPEGLAAMVKHLAP